MAQSASPNLSAARLTLTWFISAAAASAGWQDTIGYTQLKNELGSALPNGNGVSITLVEASVGLGNYAPVTVPAPASGNFAGKSFSFRSGPPGVSSHATRTGGFIFGLNTNPLVGVASEAPQAGSIASGAQVVCFDANNWMQLGSLGWGTINLPQVETSPIANHSWISVSGGGLSSSSANEILRRSDFQAEADDVVVIVGVNNDASTPIPEILASAYNVISVGITDQTLTYGGHSTGETRATVDGAGRSKPEIVAPLEASGYSTAAVSYTTAITSSCAALLTGAAQADSALNLATHSEVLRALLLAGARKTPFPTWNNTTTRPIDSHFGAGEVNIRNSYYMLAAGKQPPSTSPSDPPLKPLGWHYQSKITPGQANTYTFTIPDGCVARELSGFIVWNRRFALVHTAPQLPNLDLFLYTAPGGTLTDEITRSESGAGGSAPHTLEHIYHEDLPAGLYSWQVVNAASGSFTTDYGIAWRTSLAPAEAPQLHSLWPTSGNTLTLEFSRLGIGLRYQVRSSVDLHNWTPIHTFTAASTSETWVTTTSPDRSFFEIVWLED